MELYKSVKSSIESQWFHIYNDHQEQVGSLQIGINVERTHQAKEQIDMDFSESNDSMLSEENNESSVKQDKLVHPRDNISPPLDSD